MRKRSVVVLWLLVAAAAFGWWRWRGAEPQPASAAGPRPFLADALDPDALDRIELRREGEPPMVFAREGTEWWMVEPFRHPMDPFSMRQVGFALASAPRLRDADDTDRAAMGLAPPRATLAVVAGDRREEVQIGRRGLAGRGFLARKGEPPAVTDVALHERLLEMDPKEWRSRRLFPVGERGPDAIEAIDWIRAGEGGEVRIRLEREGAAWKLVAPISARADRPRIEDLIAAFGRVESEGFLFDSPSGLEPYGLHAPVAKVAVDAVDASLDRSVVVGSPVGLSSSARHAMVEGVPAVVRLGAAAQATLFPPLEVLVDPVASGVRSEDVKKIEIRRPDATLELVRGDDGWTLTALATDGTPVSSGPADRVAVARLLASLVAERAPEIKIADFPRELEVATIVLFGFDLAPKDIVRVARDPKSGRFALENGDGVVRIHPAALPLALEARQLAAP
jgi:hypothetical protein